MEDSVTDDIEEDKDQVVLEYIRTGDVIAQLVHKMNKELIFSKE